ncbi:MAG: LysR family transcriptional regulator [Oligoflexales bacterium]
MTSRTLRNIDLNLLVIFQAIYEIGHLGKVSKKLSLTQSAISHSLARLRDFYGDPLFVRTKSGMIPTEFTKKIAPEVKEALTAVSRTILHKRTPFDPSCEVREFVLAMGEFSNYFLLTDFYRFLAEQAPNISLKLAKGFGLDNIAGMRAGSIHLALEWLPFELSDFKMRPFLKESFSIIFRKNHPLASKGFDGSWFKDFPLICVNPREHKSAIIQKLINVFEVKAEKILNVQSMLSIPQIVAESNHIGIVTKSIATKAVKYFPIVKIEMPKAHPSASINMVWHHSMDNDEGHKWLRQIISEHCSKKASSRI